VARDLPLGEELEWTPALEPSSTPLRGSRLLLRPFVPDVDAEPLYRLSHLPDGDPSIWTYLPDGPYESPAHLRQMLEWASTADDSRYYALVRGYDERPLGMSAYLRIVPQFGSIEIGHVWFGQPLKRTAAATEAIYLLASNAFDTLGYRRVEWKCNALNAASRRAAERFGFSFEGIFRRHMVVKGRNRDTAWFAITDDRWPAIRSGFQAWLEPENFDHSERQRQTLESLIEQARREG
jgi:RimJ/RimL family protein N-acetyltransferase